MRQQETALGVMRAEFGRQGVRFDRFDIAYAVLWQRLHPTQKLSARTLAFVEESEVLSSILDLSSVPIFGTALALMKLADKAASRHRERRRVRDDEVLAGLDDLSNTEILDAITYFFAEELRSATQGAPYVFFVDAYEALAPSIPTGRTGVGDRWLRDLIGQLDRGLTVVASRESLGWRAYDAEWDDHIRTFTLPCLPPSARQALLFGAGITNPSRQATIAAASRGLPFYLHLAIDTMAGPDDSPAHVVSSEEILERFLTHVPPAGIRVLEVLSVARTFDHDVFRTLTRHFELPADRATWETLTSYSFVHHADDGLRLHQVMAAALRARLSRETRQEAHLALHQMWQRRSEAEAVGDRWALRESIFHGVRAGATGPHEVLAAADRAVRRGGKVATEAIAEDLQRFLSVQADPGLDLVARCLEAEVAIIMGDAPRAREVAERAPVPLDEEAGGRLAVAAAHSLRIEGKTTAASALYERVWRNHECGVRYLAGLWVADIEMWQGRFRTAFELCDEAIAAPDLTDPVLRGDVHRLLHLGHRFQLDYEAATKFLQTASEYYEQAGSIIGAANVLTNSVELLAWTDPGRALDTASVALDAQRAGQGSGGGLSPALIPTYTGKTSLSTRADCTSSTGNSRFGAIPNTTSQFTSTRWATHRTRRPGSSSGGPPSCPPIALRVGPTTSISTLLTSK